VCALDLESIVAKLADAPYRQTDPSHWLKIKNLAYSQLEGRHDWLSHTGHSPASPAADSGA